MTTLRRTLTALVSAAAIIFSGLAVGSPAAAASKPGVVVDYGMTPVVVKIKPKTMWPYKDVHYTKIHWTKLTGTTGYATAVRHINTCMPSCAQANYINDKVRLKFTRVKVTSTHRRVFTRVRVTVLRTHKVSTHRLRLSAY